MATHCLNCGARHFTGPAPTVATCHECPPAQDLKTLKAAADAAGDNFDRVSLTKYPDARWGAYRAIECGQDVPAAIVRAMEQYHAATHAFYLARDGAGGFLGHA